MKKIVCVSFVVCLLAAGTFYLSAKDMKIDPATLAKIKAILDKTEKECPDETVLLEDMKKAGASYIPELTVDPKKADSIVDPEQQNLMVGVYLMDMTYAFVFDKKKESFKCAEAINKLLDKCGFNNKKVYKQYLLTMKKMDSPDGKKNLTDLVNKLIDNAFNDLIKTHGGFDHTIDAFYAWLIEGLYISSEIAAQSNYDPKLIGFVNEKKPVIDTINNIFEAIKDSPDLEKITEKDERIVVLSKIKNILSAKKIGRKEIDEVRAIVTKERAEIIK